MTNGRRLQLSANAPKHRIEIPDDVINRAIRRRGSLHVFKNLDMRKTALVTIDLQNVYVAEGEIGAIATTRGIIGNVNVLAHAVREAGGTVVWIKDTRDGATSQAFWPRFAEFSESDWGRQLSASLVPGHPGHELYSELDVQPSDEIVLKNRFSALLPGASDLHERLQAKGIDTIVIAGAATNVCCESTARDAMMMNYKVFFVADATACNSDAEHNATLANMLLWYGDVRKTEDVLALIKDADPMPQPRAGSGR